MRYGWLLLILGQGCFPIINVDEVNVDKDDEAEDTGSRSDADADVDTDADGDADTDTDADSDADTDVDTDADTDADDTGMGSCDPTEVASDGICLQALCNHCTEEDCPTYEEQLARTDLCETTTTGYQYDCCTTRQCTDPAQGTFDLIHCPNGYGGSWWFFEPSTGELVTYGHIGDYAGYCDGEAIGQNFGLDLRVRDCL